VNLNTNDSNEIKIGTRVPVEGKQGEVQYIDVGTNISGRLQMRNGQLELFVHAEMSNFAIPEQAQGRDPRPVIRQLKISGSTLALLGKPMVMGSVDDPNSKRQFQLEVTMTKLR
jgi:type II secretory pathway component GspD/PulD (secretin)